MALSIIGYFYPNPEEKGSNATTFNLNLNPTSGPELDSENTLNNQHSRPPDVSHLLGSRTFTHHPKYYHPGGDVVFAVENVLFKAYSLQVQPDTEVKNFEYESIMRNVMNYSNRSPNTPGGGSSKNFEYESIMRNVMNYSNRSPNTPGASDSDPIILPGVKIAEFVHLLEIVLGRPYDNRYRKIITAAQSPDIDRPRYGARIMDAGVLAMRFGMDQLDSWAQSQILQLLKFSPSSRKENWNQDQIMKLALYIHESRISTYRRDIFESILLILEPGGLGKHLYSPEQIKSNTDACLKIYKHHTTEFSAKCPPFFGYTFIVLLSQGSESPVWKDHLRRKERAVLSAAYAGLIRLSQHDDLETDWITDPAHTQVKVICSPKCNTSFNEAISKAFEFSSPLDSTTPLEDIHCISRVASARWSFARSC
ncbi:hypothetical protein RSAG8_02464, partial [Rhizoctonia solani AG-8 WAC10335]